MKTKALISLAVTAKLICVFVFAYAKSEFSHDEARIFSLVSIFQVIRLWQVSEAGQEVIKKIHAQGNCE